MATAYTTAELNALDLSTFSDTLINRLEATLRGKNEDQAKEIADIIIKKYVQEIKGVNLQEGATIPDQLYKKILTSTSTRVFLVNCIETAVLIHLSAEPITKDQFYELISMREDFLKADNLVEFERIQRLPYTALLEGKFDLLNSQINQITPYRFNQLVIKMLQDILAPQSIVEAKASTKYNKKIDKLKAAFDVVQQANRIRIIGDIFGAKTGKYGWIYGDEQGLYIPSKRFIKSKIYGAITPNNQAEMLRIGQLVTQHALFNRQLKYSKYINSSFVKRANKYKKRLQNKPEYSDSVKTFFRPTKYKDPITGEIKKKYYTIDDNASFDQINNTAQALKNKHLLDNATRVKKYAVDKLKDLKKNDGVGTDAQLDQFLKRQLISGQINDNIKVEKYDPIKKTEIDPEIQAKLKQYSKIKQGQQAQQMQQEQ